MAKTSAVLRWDERWQSASSLRNRMQEERYPPLPLPGIQSLLAQGLGRGSIAEFTGKRSTGVTTVSLHVLAQATQRGETCAIVDLFDSFDPASAEEAAVQLPRLIWVRCGGNAEHAMRTADLLLHAGGFGVVLLHLSEANASMLNRIPLSYWYRFSRAVENGPTILLVCSDAPQVKGGCSSATVQLQSGGALWSRPQECSLLHGLQVSAHLRAGMRPMQLLSLHTVA